MIIKDNTYHELTHSAHYAALGSSWYGGFVNAEISEIEQTFLFDNGYLPYGRGDKAASPVIALGEGWAYYMGHYLADKTYGFNSSQSDEQDFSPYRLPDHFHWIPQGLFRDLNDARNEQKATGGPVDDNVSNFTNQQMFNAFQSSISTLQDYRVNLIQQNPTNPTTPQVTNLFFQYDY